MSVSKAKASSPPKVKRDSRTLYEKIEPWLFLLPALLVFGAFLYFPFLKQPI
jgi:hypothetical protein